MQPLNFDCPRLIGHRGIAHSAPENTLAGFRRAKEAGISWVEFDVMLTLDAVPIVMHDTTLSRTTNGRGDVGKTCYGDIAALDAGSWFSPAFAGERVPRFQEVLILLRELDLMANIEIKPYPGQDVATAESVLREIAEHWPSERPPPLISSFSKACMQVALNRAPELPRGLCLWQWPRNWQQQADPLDCVSVHLAQKIVSADRVKAIRNTGRKVLVYTVNDSNTARDLYALGVDGVFSDCPDRIAR